MGGSTVYMYALIDVYTLHSSPPFSFRSSFLNKHELFNLRARNMLIAILTDDATTPSLLQVCIQPV